MDGPAHADPVVARAKRLLRDVCDQNLALATAESCTGGLVAALVTDVEGCSHAFDRGFVTYTDAAKRDVLGVDDAVLREHGAVSEPVARAMAEGALQHSGADIAISVTGFAGPGGGADQKEGLVHFALARRGRDTLHAARSFGAIGRDPIRQRCLDVVLDLLERSLA